VGSIEDVIVVSIRDSGVLLVNLTRDDDEASPSGVVKDKSTKAHDHG
jgi:ArsR family metal-binding transcriptional regulator